MRLDMGGKQSELVSGAVQVDAARLYGYGASGGGGGGRLHR